MRTIGILGGMSSVASAEYYRRINDGVNAHQGGHSAAELVLYSVDFGVIEGFIRDERWDQAAQYLAERAQRVERAGAEFLILATNTMHRVAVELQASHWCTSSTRRRTQPSLTVSTLWACWAPHP